MLRVNGSICVGIMMDVKCSLCTTAAATTFCYCGHGETFLCAQRSSIHVSQHPEAFHLSLPLACYGLHKKKGDLELLQVRVAELPERAEKLSSNLAKVDKCIALFSARVEDLIQRIQDEARKITGELEATREKMKVAIETAIEEAKNTLPDEEVRSISKLGALLRDLSVPVEQLTVFSYTVTEQFALLPIRESFAFWFLERETSSQSEVTMFPSVFGNCLEMHDLVGDKPAKSFTLSHQFSDATMYCLADNMRALCIGGRSPYVKDTYWLCLKEHTLTRTADMITARGWAGVVKVGSWVYAFGGNYPKLTESERFSLNDNSWEKLTPMTKARYAFTPCLHADFIYLAELYQCRETEQFNWTSGTYTQLHISLPRSSSNTINFMQDQEMVFLTKEMQLWKWNVEKGEVKYELMDGEAPECSYLCSNCSPVRVGNRVFFVINNTGKMWSFNVESKVVSLVP